MRHLTANNMSIYRLAELQLMSITLEPCINPALRSSTAIEPIGRVLSVLNAGVALVCGSFATCRYARGSLSRYIRSVSRW